MNEVDIMKAKQVEDICIGIIARHMGFAEPKRVVSAGKEVFEYMQRMTHKQFRNVKKLKEGNK